MNGADGVIGGLPAGGAAGVNVASSIGTQNPQADLTGIVTSFIFTAVGSTNTTGSTNATSSTGRR
jgi:hypothetical protein